MCDFDIFVPLNLAPASQSIFVETNKSHTQPIICAHNSANLARLSYSIINVSIIGNRSIRKNTSAETGIFSDSYAATFSSDSFCVIVNRIIRRIENSTIRLDCCFVIVIISVISSRKMSNH